MSTNTPALDAATERRIEESRSRVQRELGRRERVTMLAFALAFVAAAGAFALIAEPARELSPWLALAFVATLAVAADIEFTVGNATAVPTQLVFVPMLLLLPTPYVPLLAAAAFVVGSGVKLLREPMAAPSRALNGIPDAWFSLAPAIVIVAFGAQLPAWGQLPVYALAIGAQLAADVLIYTARVRIGCSTRRNWR